MRDRNNGRQNASGVAPTVRRRTIVQSGLLQFLVAPGFPRTPPEAKGEPGALPHVADNTSLQSLPSTYAKFVVRDDYAAEYGAPPTVYKSSSSPPSLNDGGGDGGAQVKSADGGSWTAIFPAGGADIRVWGAKADGVTDSATALAAAAASGVAEINIPAGIFLISSAVKLDRSLIFLPGAILKPARGVTVTIGEPVIVDPLVQCFDVSAGGSIVVGSGIEFTPNMFGVDASGSVDNRAALEAFCRQTKTFGRSLPRTVTLTLGTPGTVNLVSHGLRVNEAVVFSTTGALPTGLADGTVYYVMAANLTADTFRVSRVNAYVELHGDGPAVAMTGTQSGIHSIQTRGTEWQTMWIPPGAYYSSEFQWMTGNQKRLRVSAYGATSNNMSFGALSLGMAKGGYIWTDRYASALINSTTGLGDRTIKLINAGDAAKFWVGGWICVVALDLQNAYGSPRSAPPNNHYFEFVQVSAIDSSVGVIALSKNLRSGYKSTFPLYWPGNDRAVAGGGPATIYPLSADWDMEIHVYGLHETQTGQVVNPARAIRYVDCVFDGQGAIPGGNKSFVAENCIWGNRVPDSVLEIDKLIECARFTNCTISRLRTQSTSIDRLIVDGSTIEVMEGTAKLTHIRDCDIQILFVGPLAFGASEAVLIENCRIDSIGESPRLDAAGGPFAFNNLVNNFTFSDGTLRQPINTTASNWWTVPGRRMYVNDMAGEFANMGSPFVIYDVYVSGSDVCIDTSLTKLPRGNSTSASVTISTALPAVVNWTAHGLRAGMPVCFQTTGTLPHGLSTTKLYYVLASGLTADSFGISTSAKGGPLGTSGSQTGTHTCISNPLHFQPQACPRVTVRNSTGCLQIADLSNGPDNVPLFSFASRQYVGYIDTNISFLNPPLVYGNLVKLIVKVLRPFTGSTPSDLAMTVRAFAFDENLIQDDLVQIINLRMAGERIITPSGTSGAQKGDALTPTGNWISGKVNVAYSAVMRGSFAKTPIVQLIIQTDQGFTDPANIQFGGPMEPHSVTLSDTTVEWRRS